MGALQGHDGAHNPEEAEHVLDRREDHLGAEPHAQEAEQPQRARERLLGSPRAAERLRGGDRRFLHDEDLSRQRMSYAVKLPALECAPSSRAKQPQFQQTMSTLGITRPGSKKTNVVQRPLLHHISAMSLDVS